MTNTPKCPTNPESKIAFLPDVICLYRALAAVYAVILGPHPAAPWLFSTALISDLFDGWIYRHYTVYHPVLSKRPYLPCDPLADFVLIIAGTVYATMYWWRLGWDGTAWVLAAVVIAAAIMHVIPYIRPSSHMLYTVCTTVMTHISCCVMLVTTVIVWRVNTDNWGYPIVTLAVFYAIFGVIGDKERLIRRPPASWNSKG